jgi:hypothetical protein
MGVGHRSRSGQPPDASASPSPWCCRSLLLSALLSGQAATTRTERCRGPGNAVVGRKLSMNAGARPVPARRASGADGSETVASRTRPRSGTATDGPCPRSGGSGTDSMTFSTRSPAARARGQPGNEQGDGKQILTRHSLLWLVGEGAPSVGDQWSRARGRAACQSLPPTDDRMRPNGIWREANGPRSGARPILRGERST